MPYQILSLARPHLLFFLALFFNLFGCRLERPQRNPVGAGVQSPMISYTLSVYVDFLPSILTRRNAPRCITANTVEWAAVAAWIPHKANSSCEIKNSPINLSWSLALDNRQ